MCCAWRLVVRGRHDPDEAVHITLLHHLLASVSVLSAMEFMVVNIKPDARRLGQLSYSFILTGQNARLKCDLSYSIKALKDFGNSSCISYYRKSTSIGIERSSSPRSVMLQYKFSPRSHGLWSSAQCQTDLGIELQGLSGPASFQALGFCSGPSSARGWELYRRFSHSCRR